MVTKSESAVYHVAKTIAVLLVVIAPCTNMPPFVFLSGAIYIYGADQGKYRDLFLFLRQKARHLWYLPTLFWVYRSNLSKKEPIFSKTDAI